MHRLLLAILLVAGYGASASAEVGLLAVIGEWRVSFIGSEKGEQVGGWCRITQLNEHAIGYDELTIFGLQTVYRDLVYLPQVHTGVRRAVGYQIDDNPYVSIESEWRGEDFVHIRTPNIIRQMLLGRRLAIYQDLMYIDGKMLPPMEYSLEGLKEAMEWFNTPICREDLARSQ